MTLISVLVCVEESRQMRKPDGICPPGRVVNIRERKGLSALVDWSVKMSTEGDEVKKRGCGS